MALGLVVAGVAAWLRLPLLDVGYSGDELANFTPGTLWSHLIDPETGINPPTVRWFIALMPRSEALDAARLLAVVSNGLAVGLAAAWTTRLAADDEGRVPRWAWLAGAVAGLLLAYHPESIKASATARAYGPVSLAWVLHGLALTAWVRAPEDRRAMAAVALSAVALPWLHYQTVPTLLLTGLVGAAVLPRLRRLVLLYVPAGLAFAPLGLFMLSVTERRAEPWRSVGNTVDLVLSLALPNGLWFDGIGLGLAHRWPSAESLLVAGGLLGGLLAWRRLGDPLRLAWIAAVANLPTVAILGTQQEVRPPVSILFAVLVVPVLAASWRASPRGWVSAIGACLVPGALLAPAAAHDVGPEAPGRYENAVRAAARALGRGDLPDRYLLVHPYGELLPMVYYVSGLHASEMPPGEVCAPFDACVAYGDQALLPRVSLEPVPGALVLSFARREPGSPDPMPGCDPVDLVEGVSMWRCPR